MFTTYPISIDVSISYPSVDYPVPVYTTGTATEQANGWAFNTSKAILHRPDWSNGAGRPAILACHGGNQDAWSTFAPGDGRWGDYTRYLADIGFVVMACDLGALVSGNNLAMRALDQLYSYVQALGCRTKVGLIGSSAGALSCLNWLHKWPDRVGGVYTLNGFTDMEVNRGDTDWVTPWQILPTDPNADLYAQRGFIGPYAGMGADPAGNNSSYKCTNEASFKTNAVNQGHVPYRYPTDFAPYNIVLANAYRDPTVPYQMGQKFVELVNSPTVKFRPVSIATAGHNPGTLLGAGGNDASVVAAGGLPRYALRDFFSEVL